jgi:uncharacterized protein YecT (DUF1311 family)
MQATTMKSSVEYRAEEFSGKYNPSMTYQKFSPSKLNEVEALISNDNACKAADDEMAAVYNRIRSDFGQNSAKKDTLKADQLNWLYFRTSVLNSVPTSSRSAVFIQLTKERLNNLLNR